MIVDRIFCFPGSPCARGLLHHLANTCDLSKAVTVGHDILRAFKQMVACSGLLWLVQKSGKRGTNGLREHGGDLESQRGNGVDFFSAADIGTSGT
jgi:hypothetical protein